MSLDEQNPLVPFISFLLAVRSHLTFLNNQSTLLDRYLHDYTTSPDRSTAKGKAARRALIVIANIVDRLEVFKVDVDDEKEVEWSGWPTWITDMKMEVTGLQNGIEKLRDGITAYLRFVVEE